MTTESEIRIGSASVVDVVSPTAEDVIFDSPQESAINHELLAETLEYIRPALQADGGDMILLGTSGSTVHIQLVGACGGCPLSTMTLTSGIERIVADRVDGVEAVVAI